MKEILAALVAAQKEMPQPRLDANNPHFRSKYTSLPELVRTVKPVFARHGLTWRWVDYPAEMGVKVGIQLIHDSGQTLDGSEHFHPLHSENIQQRKSAHTYLRRITLESLAAIAGDDDDDGNAAAAAPKAMSEKDAKALSALLDAADPETREGCHAFGEAWLELSQDEQASFGPWVGKFYPGAVSATKAKMRDILAVYRETLHGEAA